MDDSNLDCHESTILLESRNDVLEGLVAQSERLFLISRNTCSEAIEEWYAAHQLLLMAVNDGTVTGSPHFNNVDSWWLEQLYMPITLIECESEEDHERIKSCLRQAENCGVVSSADAIIGDMFVAGVFTERVSALHRAGIMIWERLLENEKRILQNEQALEELTESLRQYRACQRNSQLIGIVLQLIPIAGGSLTGLLSAGAEIVDGLSPKDIVDYILGFFVSASQEVSLFSGAIDLISPENVELMDEYIRNGLIRSVEEGGLDMEVLRTMIRDRQNELNSAISVERDTTTAQDPHNPSDNDIVSTLNQEDNDDGQAPQMLGFEADAQTQNGHNAFDAEESGDESIEQTAVEEDSEQMPSFFSTMRYHRDTIAALDQVTIARWWAAHCVRFMDDKVREYKEIHVILFSYLQEEELFAMDFVVDDDVTEGVCTGAISKISERIGRRPPLGFVRRLKEFVRKTTSVEHIEA